TNEWSFTVADYKAIALTPPIYFETFDGVGEGLLPEGWTVTNNTTRLAAGMTLDDPRSDSYLNWVLISSNRLASVYGSTRLGTPLLAVNGEILDALVH